MVRAAFRYPPYAFTEHGALMLSSVLSSDRASEISIRVVRAFVYLRRLVPAHQEISMRLAEMESKLTEHDHALAGIIEAIKALVAPPKKDSRPIGL